MEYQITEKIFYRAATFPDPPETDNDVLGNIKFRSNSIEYYISYLCYLYRLSLGAYSLIIWSLVRNTHIQYIYILPTC